MQLSLGLAIFSSGLIGYSPDQEQPDMRILQNDGLLAS